MNLYLLYYAVNNTAPISEQNQLTYITIYDMLLIGVTMRYAVQPSAKRVFLALWKGGYMVSHIELLTFCLVAIGIAGLTVKIIDVIVRLKRK